MISQHLVFYIIVWIGFIYNISRYFRTIAKLLCHTNIKFKCDKTMRQTIIFLVLMLQVSISTAACLSDQQLQQLTNNELNYLSQKIPPTFEHAYQQNKISINVVHAENDPCQAQLLVTVPQSDVDEAHAILETQPAKKIMLTAQGYALPIGEVHAATFSVDVDTLKIDEKAFLQTAPLGKLRASLELMYAFLTQKRAEVIPSNLNQSAWPKNIKQQVVNSCSAHQSLAVCTCLADTYEKKITANQMEYIQYVRANPYALATGANQGFEAIKLTAEAACN